MFSLASDTAIVMEKIGGISQYGWVKAYGENTATARNKLANEDLTPPQPPMDINSEHFSAWVAVVTTIGVAITAHLSASRLDYLVDSYLATAERLDSYRNQWLDKQHSSAPQAVSKFVRDCEDAISVENKGWIAKFLQANN